MTPRNSYSQVALTYNVWHQQFIVQDVELLSKCREGGMNFVHPTDRLKLIEPGSVNQEIPAIDFDLEHIRC